MTPSGDATLDLTTSGEHDLEAWMREDGLRVDRVLLVTDTNYIPSGLGPSESPLQTITETVPGGLGTTSISYGYDDLYRLTDAAYTGAITATFAYDYDPVGNMTAFTETVDAQTTGVARTFDAANRLEYAVDASGTTTYTYDARGNLIELLPPGATGATPVGGVRYDYDQRNLMVSQETNPDGTAWVLQAEYVYDGGNDRLQQVDYTGATPITTTYTNDIIGLTQVLVADDGTNEVHNLFGLDLISQDSGSEVRTLLVDGLDSVRLEMVDSVVETATTYTPYGEVLERAGTSGTVYGFTGEQEDSATGLLYLRARYYSPQLKVFQSRDPWEGTGWRPGTLNYYAYVHANPMKYSDRSGYCPAPVDSEGQVICVDLFIQAEFVDPLHFGYGDNRGFETDSHPSRSRAYMYMYLNESGTLRNVEVHINPSCTRLGCFGPELEYDLLEVVQRENGDLHVTWDLLNGFSGELRALSDEIYAEEADTGAMPIGSGVVYLASTPLPAINGTMTLSQVDDKYQVTSFNRDPYPSIEVYSYQDGEFDYTLAQLTEHGLGAFWGLNPLARNERYNCPVWYSWSDSRLLEGSFIPD